MARKLADGRIEFGLQPRTADNTWDDRQLPRVRFFPTTATIGRWLASSALDMPAGEVRIVTRKLESGRIEFGLQQRAADDAWGDRQLPRVRFFPTTAGVGRWLASSPLTLGTPRPADRDAAVTDDDQTTSQPADRDAPVTDDDQYEQFEGDILEVANPHVWWRQPRGDLVVHVHLCVEQGNEHLAKRELIDAYVHALNEIEAPFYAWQSSGLLNVSFTAGTIAIADDVASHWFLGYLPDSCRRSLSLSTEAHIGHAVILAGNPDSTERGGWGRLRGPPGVTYIKDAAGQTVASVTGIKLDQTWEPAWRYQPSELPLQTFVARHEFDHNIGVIHLAHSGVTRYREFPSPEEWEELYGGDGDVKSWRGGQLVGTFSGFPAVLQQQRGLNLFPCGFLEEQGWPVGPNNPACIRLPPLPPVLRVVWQADGTPGVTWEQPSHQSTVPATGYKVLVSTATFDSQGHPTSAPRIVRQYYPIGEIVDRGDSIIFEVDLPADARSFVLPLVQLADTNTNWATRSPSQLSLSRRSGSAPPTMCLLLSDFRKPRSRSR